MKSKRAKGYLIKQLTCEITRPARWSAKNWRRYTSAWLFAVLRVVTLKRTKRTKMAEFLSWQNLDKLCRSLKSWLLSLAAKPARDWILLIAVLAVGSLVAVAPLILILPRPTSEYTQNSECSSQQNIQVPQPKAIASQDFTTLINAAAYLFYPEDSGLLAFVDLQLEHVVRSNGTLLLEGKCAAISFSVQSDTRSNKLKIAANQLEIFRGTRTGSECEIVGFTYEDDSAKRYSCRETFRYKCRDKLSGKVTFWLSFSTLEIEVDGNLESIKEGKFNKPKSELGCV